MPNTNSVSDNTPKQYPFAPLSEESREKLTELERILSQDSQKSVALVAYLV